MTESLHICGVVLAAGASSRMGRDKALLPWPPLQTETSSPTGTFLSSAINLLKCHTEFVLVVAGRNAATLATVIEANGAIACVNENPELGQFSSLKAGLQEALNRGCDAAIITPVDRTPVTESTLAHLLAEFLRAVVTGYWAAIPQFEGKHGHPLAMGREMIDEMLGAPLTSTGRDVIHANVEHVLYLPVDDPAVTMNVNTWEDYQRLSLSRG